MNDFTKEELQIILLDMNTYIHRAGILTVPKHHMALRDKIESMIDNYCEHENYKEDEWMVKVCQKCRKVYP